MWSRAFNVNISETFMEGVYVMKISEIIDFLGTDTISVTFSPNGLKYLSLRDKDGEELINIKKFNNQKEQDTRIDLVIKETLNFFETGSHNMPLDLIDFTSFQQAVFNAVSKISVGEIYTYKEVAIMIGNPDAARAVGNALSKNPVAYFIPAHRILPKKGIGTCKGGAAFLRHKLLTLEGHDIEKLRGNNI